MRNLFSHVKVVAEQVGAQIFIDGWTLAAPAKPALAAELAGKAASVSHDGEAVYAPQPLAAMEAQAFVEARVGSASGDRTFLHFARVSGQPLGQ